MQLSDFEVLRRAGSGIASEVLVARRRDATGGRGSELKVVKLLTPEARSSSRARERFEYGASIACTIQHPNVARVLGSFSDFALGPCFWGDFIEGIHLGELAHAGGPSPEIVPEGMAARIVEQAARGLQYAHEVGDRAGARIAYLHGGVSLWNIHISTEGAIRVSDLGTSSARLFYDSLDRIGDRRVFIAPELFTGGGPSVRVDVFSLGVVFCALLLCGARGQQAPEARARSPRDVSSPRPGARAALEPTLRALSSGALATPLELGHVSDQALAVLKRALATSPSERFPSVAAFADALIPIASSIGSTAPLADLVARMAARAGRPSAALPPPDDGARRSSLSASALLMSRAPDAVARSSSLPAIALPDGSDDPTNKLARVAEPPLAPPPPPGEDAPAGPKKGGVLSPGAKFGRYVIEKLIGTGGVAEVYQAQDSFLKRTVALKLVHPDQGDHAHDALIFEAQAAANFVHPNSVVIFDVGEVDGLRFISMEFIKGKRLGRLILDASIPVARRARWMVNVARALSAAHKRGLVHRDVKPSNIMIRDDGEVKVVDFGIARVTKPEVFGEAYKLRATVTGMVVGTPRYAAPEQLRGEKVDARADQFSWGMTAFELFARRSPWPGETPLEVAVRIVVEQVPPLRDAAPDVPEEICAVIDRALSKEPDARFPTLDDAADALEPFAEGSTRLSSFPAEAPAPPSARPPLSARQPTVSAVDLSEAPAAKPPATNSRRTLAIGGGAAAALVLAGAVAAALARGSPGSTDAGASAAAAAPITGLLHCKPASLKGAADPELARAVGVGACARLAVEIGVDWDVGVSADPTVAVTGEVRADDVTIEISVGASVKTKTSGASPLAAIDAAVAALAEKIPRPPASERQIRLWGAKDGAGAQRIERAWRRQALWLGANASAEIQRLVETDPESPFPHLMMLMTSTGSPESVAMSKDKAFALAPRLPPAREHLVRGLLLALPVEVDRPEAIRLTRLAYAEASDDADLAALFGGFGVQMGLPEAFGVVDRAYATSPSRSMTALERAIASAPDRDLARADKYVRASTDILPETVATLHVVRHLIAKGKLDDARSAVALGRAFGVGQRGGEPALYASAQIDLELAAGRPDEARTIAKEMLGDPRSFAQVVAANSTVSSYLLEGHIEPAEATLLQEIERHRSMQDVSAAVPLVSRLLRLRRLLKRPPSDEATLKWLERALLAKKELGPCQRAEGLVELALARRGKAAAKAREDALAEVNRLAEEAGAEGARLEARSRRRRSRSCAPSAAIKRRPRYGPRRRAHPYGRGSGPRSTRRSPWKRRVISRRRRARTASLRTARTSAKERWSA